jgi:Mn2+/Fe2+ NRAMP family transporter
MSSSTRSTLIGAMFLMATSAIGPGFITQTTSFYLAVNSVRPLLEPFT